MPQTQLGSGGESAMSVEQALRVLADHRRERQIVVSNQMSARLWPLISGHPLDFNYLSSTMGGAVPLGLGLALARPECDVIVLSGDGSLLMSLGALVTVAACQAVNLTIVLLDNGIYEVTGGQTTPGCEAQVDYAGLACAAGFSNVAAFWELEAWREHVATGWEAAGPRLFWLRVRPAEPATPRCTTTHVAEEFRRLRAELAAHSFRTMS